MSCLFSNLVRQKAEDFLTEILAYLLRKREEGISKQFLEKIGESPAPKGEWKTQYSPCGREMRWDLFFEADDSSLLVLVENKIWARLNENQTTNYHGRLGKLQEEKKVTKAVLVILAPERRKDILLGKPERKFISWEELLSGLTSVKGSETQIMLGHMKQFYDDLVGDQSPFVQGDFDSTHAKRNERIFQTVGDVQGCLSGYVGRTHPDWKLRVWNLDTQDFYHGFYFSIEVGDKTHKFWTGFSSYWWLQNREPSTPFWLQVLDEQLQARIQGLFPGKPRKERGITSLPLVLGPNEAKTPLNEMSRAYLEDLESKLQVLLPRSKEGNSLGETGFKGNPVGAVVHGAFEQGDFDSAHARRNKRIFQTVRHMRDLFSDHLGEMHPDWNIRPVKLDTGDLYHGFYFWADQDGQFKFWTGFSNYWWLQDKESSTPFWLQVFDKQLQARIPGLFPGKPREERGVTSLPLLVGPLDANTLPPIDMARRCLGDIAAKLKILLPGTAQHLDAGPTA